MRKHKPSTDIKTKIESGTNSEFSLHPLRNLDEVQFLNRCKPIMKSKLMGYMGDFSVVFSSVLKVTFTRHESGEKITKKFGQRQRVVPGPRLLNTMLNDALRELWHEITVFERELNSGWNDIEANKLCVNMSRLM